MNTLIGLAVAAALAATATPVPDTTTPAPAAASTAGFDWTWVYDAPTCDGITVTFPDDLPASQQGVVEVNVQLSSGTLQYKLEGDAYRAAYPDGHAGATLVLPWSAFRGGTVPAEGEWQVTWVQVHGTNYHWTGEVRCGEPAVDPEDPVDPADPADPVHPAGDDDGPLDPAVPEALTDLAGALPVQSEVLAAADEGPSAEVLATTGVPARTAALTGAGLVLLGAAGIALRSRVRHRG